MGEQVLLRVSRQGQVTLRRASSATTGWTSAATAIPSSSPPHGPQRLEAAEARTSGRARLQDTTTGLRPEVASVG
jgi:succinylarginine dihydrolase